MGGKNYFAYDGSHFSTTFHVKPECVEAFQELVRELVDWRLADYLAGEES
jgi:hypothetical protein